MFSASYLADLWVPGTIPSAAPVQTFLQAESYEHYFRAYVDVDLPKIDGGFGFISVNGMARQAAIRRAVELLRPEKGVLVLANSQRARYAATASIVPAHWHMHTSGDERGATTVWLSRRAEESG